MSTMTSAQLAIAQLAERFTPEIRRRITVFFAVSLGIALITLIVLALINATYEPLVWSVLVIAGAGYGWYAHGELASDASVKEQWVFYADDETMEDE